MAMSIRPSCSAGAQQHRLKRRGAGRVEGQVGAAQAEGAADGAGDAAGGDVGGLGRAARQRAANGRNDFLHHRLLLFGRQRAELLRFAEKLGGLFDAGGVRIIAGQPAALGVADEHARIGQRKVERIQAGVAAGVGRHLAHQQMAGIGRVDEFVRDRALVVVELAAGKDGSQLGIRFSDDALAGIVIQRLVEAVGGKLADGGAPLDKQPPELVEIVGSGQTASHADNGQGHGGFRIG